MMIDFISTFSDPTSHVGLMSLDMGSVYSDDGREHPVTGLIPLSPLTPSGASVATRDDCSQYTVGSFAWQRCMALGGSNVVPINPDGTVTNPLGGLVSNLMGGGLLRIVLIIIAILLLVVVAFRLTRM